jgi:hypothetical protein
MFDNNRFICMLNNCSLDENKPFAENYNVVRKSKVDGRKLDQQRLDTDHEFFATLMENLVGASKHIDKILNY